VQVAFKNALARAALVRKCGKDVACYSDRLTKVDANEPAMSALSEKAAFMLGRMGRPALPHLQKHVAHKDSATRFTVMFALTRVANKGDKDVQKAVADQIEIDKSKPPLLPLVEEMRVTLAIISRQ
jgi:hypothetical protein